MLTLDSLSATILCSPLMCCGMIEARSLWSRASRCCTLDRSASVDAKPFLMIYTTPVLSVNKFMHIPCIYGFTAYIAAITASSSLAVEPMFYCSALNVLRANMGMFSLGRCS